MNSAALARTAYRQTTAIAASERTVEYRVFAKVTAELAAAGQSDDAAAFPRLAEAIASNRRLWTVLASNVASNDNQLPDALRAQIISLANFTWEHSKKVLRRKAGVGPLVDVNTAIMRGLRGASPNGDED
ncbi:MAG: flagellar biosynthesis regulator FlaF [Pseudomonadota bacterium]